MTATEQGYQQQRQQQRVLGLVSTHITSPKPPGSHHQAIVSPRSAHQAHNGGGSSRPFSAVFKKAQTACGMTYQLQPDALIAGAGDHHHHQQQAGSAAANTVKSPRRLAQQRSKLLLLQQQQQRHALLHQQQQDQRVLLQQLGATSVSMYASWGGPGAVPQANIAYSSRPVGAFGANHTTATGAAAVPLQCRGFNPIDMANVLAPVTPEQTADSAVGGELRVCDAGVPCKHSTGAVGQPRFDAFASPAAAAAAAAAAGAVAKKQQQQQQQQRLGLSVSMPMSHHLYADSAAAQFDDSALQRPAKRQPHMQGASMTGAGGCLDLSAWPAFGSGPFVGQGTGPGVGQALSQGFTAGFLQGVSQAQLQLLVTPAAVLLLQQQQQQQHADLDSANRSYSVQRRPSRKRRHAAASPDAGAAAAAEAAADIAAADRGAGEQQPSQTIVPAAAAGSIAQLLHVSDSTQAAAQLARMSRAELFRFAAVAIGHGGSSTEHGLSSSQHAAGHCKQDGPPAAAAAAAAGAKCTADCSPASSASTAGVCLSSGHLQQELEGFYSKPMTPQEAAEEAQAAAAAIGAAAKTAAAVMVHSRLMYSLGSASPAASQQQEANGLSPRQQQQQQQPQEEGPLSPVATPAAPAAAQSPAESWPQHSSSALAALPTSPAPLAASPVPAAAAAAAAAAPDCGASGADVSLAGSAGGAAASLAASDDGGATGFLLHGGRALGVNVALGARAGSGGSSGLEGFTPVSVAVLAGAVVPETPFGNAGFEDVPFAWGAAGDDWELPRGW